MLELTSDQAIVLMIIVIVETAALVSLLIRRSWSSCKLVEAARKLGDQLDASDASRERQGPLAWWPEVGAFGFVDAEGDRYTVRGERIHAPCPPPAWSKPS